MNILIKLMSIVSLVVAPTLAQLYGNGNTHTGAVNNKTVTVSREMASGSQLSPVKDAAPIVSVQP